MYTLNFYQLLLFFRYPRKFRVVVVVFLFFNRERHCKKLSIRIVRLLHMLCFSIRDFNGLDSFYSTNQDRYLSKWLHWFKGWKTLAIHCINLYLENGLMPFVNCNPLHPNINVQILLTLLCTFPLLLTRRS